MRTTRGESRVWLAPLFFLGAATASAIYLFRRFDRYAVDGRSMLPTLQEGDWVIVDRRAYPGVPGPGDVVVARDPREPTRLVFKRVNHIDLHKRAWLLGDNSEESTDSRVFGGVAQDAVLGKVRWRYWPPGRAGRVR
ncbi:MAG: nickel-type superoxide dismutase maturation protease [Tepidiformaceae bacterium]